MKRRHRNEGLRKICECSRRAWPKCPHSWHLNYKPRHGGKHYRLSLDKHAGRHVDSKTEAQQVATTIRASILAGTFRAAAPEPAAPTTPEAVTLATVVERFLEGFHPKKARDRAAWAKQAGYMLAQVLAFEQDGQALKDRAVGSLTLDDLETFMRALRAKGRAASTRNHYVQLLTDVFRWAMKRGYLTRSPLADVSESDVRRSKIATRRRRLNGDEEARLLKAATNDRLYRLIVAALETGCRQGELLSLQWREVDLKRGEIRLLASKTKDAEDRIVPISPRLRAVLEMARLDPAGHELAPVKYVFHDGVGDRLKSPKKAWANTCRAAGIEDLRFHDLRHEAGSRFLERGMPLHYVQAMLGHANIDQTSTYLNATLPGLKKEMARICEAPAPAPAKAEPQEQADQASAVN